MKRLPFGRKGCLLILAAGALSALALAHWLSSLDEYQDGEYVRLRSSFRVPGRIDDFAVDEEAGRLVVVTPDAVCRYTYPTLRLGCSRSMTRLRLVGLLPHGIVVTNADYEVLLLHPDTLSTIAHYPGRHQKVALNHRSSTIAMLQESNTLLLLKIGEAGIISRQNVAFPDARSVIALAVLPSGGLLYSTNLQPAFYHLRPPYKLPAILEGNSQSVSTIQFDQSGESFLTYEPGALRVWDLATMKPVMNLWVYLPDNGGTAGVRIENATGRGYLAAAHPGARTPLVRARYCASRRLVVINDGMPKRGIVLFVSADSHSIVDQISAHSGLWVHMYLSADGKTLVTGAHNVIRFWDIPEFE